MIKKKHYIRIELSFETISLITIMILDEVDYLNISKLIDFLSL